MNSSFDLRKKRMININPLDPEKREFRDNDLVCYCFKYTKKQIEEDLVVNGQSMILQKILLEKKTGGCGCAQKNPKGR